MPRLLDVAFYMFRRSTEPPWAKSGEKSVQERKRVVYGVSSEKHSDGNFYPGKKAQSEILRHYVDVDWAYLQDFLNILSSSSSAR